MYHVSAQGVDERIINVHFYCYDDDDDDDDSTLAVLPLQKGCDLWTLSYDFVPHN